MPPRHAGGAGGARPIDDVLRDLARRQHRAARPNGGHDHLRRIWAQDPDPRHVHAAYADRDNVGGTDDYVALILDTRGDGRVGTIFRISPRGVQADGVFNEAQFALGNPDDLTPDFAWDARTAIGV